MKNLFLTAFFLCLCSVFVYNRDSASYGRLPAMEGLSSKQKEVQIYNSLFPYYVQVCSHSKKEDSASAVTVFLKGACLDEAKDLPRLKLCDTRDDLASYDAGVGLSAHSVFENVSWMAAPGRELFYEGNLGREEKLNVPARERAVSAMIKSGWLKGIKIKDEVLKMEAKNLGLSLEEIKERPRTYQEAIASSVVGNGFALSFKKSSFCSRVPLPKEKFKQTVKFVNLQNQDLARGAEVWNGYFSGLAAALEIKYENAASAYQNQNIRNSLLSQEPWLPSSLGGVVEVIPARPGHDKGASRFVSADPKHERHYDLRENLRFHAREYEKIWSKRKSLNQMYHEDVRPRLGTEEEGAYDKKSAPAFTKFYKAFYQQIIHLGKDAEEKLYLMNKMEKTL